jgi:hypothetical protein
VAATLVHCLAASAGTEGLSLESTGVRGGFPARPASYGFGQAEAFIDWRLPYSAGLGKGFFIESRLDLSLGWLGEASDNAFIGTVGPIVFVRHECVPIQVEGGISPTILSRDEFESEDFGLLFQFTTHIGLEWNIGDHLRVGYRYQHMSNASIAHPNPGLNMHCFSVSCRF